jgi:hypothetical protein
MSDDLPPIRPTQPPSEPTTAPTTVPTETQPPPESAYVVQMLLGFVAFWCLFLGTIGSGLYGMAMIQMRSMGNRGFPTAIGIIPLVLLGAGVSMWIWRYKRGRGFVPGLLTGLGLLGLGAGICFTTMR